MFYQSVHTYAQRLKRGVVFPVETTKHSEKIFMGREGRRCLYSTFDKLPRALTPDHDRFRVCPATVGKMLSQLIDRELFLEVCEDKGTTVHGNTASGFIAVLPPLAIPLDETGLPLHSWARNCNFLGHRWPMKVVLLNRSDDTNANPDAHRLWLMRQFSNRGKATDFNELDVRRAVLLKNGDRYIVDAVGKVSKPQGELYRLPLVAFMNIVDTQRKKWRSDGMAGLKELAKVISPPNVWLLL